MHCVAPVSSISAGMTFGTSGQHGTSWREQHSANCRSLVGGGPRRWLDVMPTLHRSNCVRRPTDLLRFGIQHRWELPPKVQQVVESLVPAVGIEPTTNGLQNRCSTTVSYTHLTLPTIY